MAKLKFNGVVTEVYTTPEKDKVNSIETGANKTEFATTNEATTATDNTKAMTPLRTKEAILALSPSPDLSGYATIVALDEKVDAIAGKGLSTNDYDNVSKSKVDAIPNSPEYTDTKYTAGTNITIDENNEISATDTTYTAGTNISISNNKINVTDVVTSVAGKTGAVTLTKTDVGLSNVTNIGHYSISEADFNALSSAEKTSAVKFWYIQKV